MAIEMKPCKYCGSDHVNIGMIQHGIYGNEVFGECYSCHSRGRSIFTDENCFMTSYGRKFEDYTSYQKAVELWNIEMTDKGDWHK